MKRTLALECTAVILVSLIAAGTYALISKESTAKNVITTGKIGFEIVETTDTGEKFPVQGVKIMPGDTVSKIVSVENTGRNALYLRIKLTKGVEDEPQLPAEEQLTPDINTTDWTYKDGYYYYNNKLEPGDKTTPLFTKVEIDGEKVDNKYVGKTFYLNIDGSAVQAANNTDSVFTAQGWSDINN